MKVAALQWDVRRCDAAWNLAAASAGLEHAREAGVDLVLLPEMWATSFPDSGDDCALQTRAARDAALRLCDTSSRLGVGWAGSGFCSERAGERPTNRLELFADGEWLLAYDKLHLFGPTAEDSVFRAGSSLPPTITWRGLRVSAVICYDLRFPELTRAPFYAAAELLLVPAQWPSERATQWRALVHGLAASGQCFVLACNRTGSESVGRRELRLEFPGNSLLVDPTGRTLAEGRGEPGLVVGEVDARLARELQQKIPVRRDLREDVYGARAGSEAERR
ncbi:MAG TPA: nitrilase-related carbon-nitrogen hydrolase [Planctomycetota bacterium]|nr:nitrilase-related carbon-nitrogen hydrolase [Planctomycetota bacterium]